MKIPIILFVMLCPFVLAVSVYAQMGSGITTYIPDTSLNALMQTGKAYDISATVLDTGYSVDLEQGDIIRLDSLGETFYAIVTNISEGAVTIAHGKLSDLNAGTPPTGFITLRTGQSETLNLVQGDNSQLLEFKAVDISAKATVFIKTVVANPEAGAGKALFDINLDVNKASVASSKDLTAYVQFINFGQGPTKVDITYTIADRNGKEYYRGVDSKVVYTEEAAIKNFDFLTLPQGMYTITTHIAYGQNQSAVSRKDFTVSGATPWTFLLWIGFAFVGLAALSSYLTRRARI